jgi:predicted GIY-YIG superfamily endonuclease
MKKTSPVAYPDARLPKAKSSDHTPEPLNIYGRPIAGVYLLHFTKPFGRARHYIGWSPDINRRVSRHKEGKGAKFTMGALRHGADLLLVRTWPGGDRRLEWKLKHKGTHQTLCPHTHQTLCPLCNTQV